MTAESSTPHCERCENDPTVAWTSYTGAQRTGLWTCDICGQPAGTLDGEAEAEAPALRLRAFAGFSIGDDRD